MVGPFEAQLGLLEEAVRAPMRAAIATPSGAHEAVLGALTAVKWPPHTSPIPLPGELTGPQRALAEILAHLPKQRTHAFAIPLDTWNRRRWLGLTPPGVLEAPRSSGSPLPRWRHLDEKVATILGELTLGPRLQAVAELALDAYRFAHIRLVHELADDFYRAIDGSAADEAEQVLDFCIEVLDGPDWFPHRGELPEPAKTALCLAVVRGGRRLAERHERFLPFTGGSHTLLVRECVAAIAEERRAFAIAKAASHAHPAYAELLLLELLVDVPEEPVLEALRATARGGRPRKVVDDALRALAREHASIAGLVKGKAQPKTRVLSFRPQPLPAFDAMPDLLARQLGPLLEQAKEEGAREQIELFAVLDARGKHLYDLHLFCGDDGPVYEAGTLDHVASFSQGGATESDDEQLLDAIDLALYRWRRARKRPTKLPAKTATKSTRKRAATKAPTKKR